jgi:hypothetical protein
VTLHHQANSDTSDSNRCPFFGRLGRWYRPDFPRGSMIAPIGNLACIPVSPSGYGMHTSCFTYALGCDPLVLSRRSLR